MWIKRTIKDEDESFKISHMISGIGNSLGLVSAILFGFLFEKGKISWVKNSFLYITYINILFTGKRYLFLIYYILFFI